MEVQPTDFLKMANAHIPNVGMSFIVIHFLENYTNVANLVDSLNDVQFALDAGTGNIAIVFKKKDIEQYDCWCRFVDIEKRLMN